jgi:hypothetical protein
MRVWLAPEHIELPLRLGGIDRVDALLSLVITFFDEAMFLLHFNFFAVLFLLGKIRKRKRALDVYKALGVERSVLVGRGGPLHKLVISHAKQLYLAEIPEKKLLHQTSSNSLVFAL